MSGIQIMPRPEDMIRHNKKLGDQHRSLAVFPHFSRPVRKTSLDVFYRIGMVEAQLASGSDKFFFSDFQKNREFEKRVKMCTNCWRAMRQTREFGWQCHTMGCECVAPLSTHYGKPSSAITHIDTPPRGIIGIHIFADFVRGSKDETYWTLEIDPDGQLHASTERYKQLNGIHGKSMAPGYGMVERHTTVEWVDRCILVLDRPYPDITLASVYRTVGIICDQQGWRLQ